MRVWFPDYMGFVAVERFTFPKFFARDAAGVQCRVPVLCLGCTCSPILGQERKA